MKKKIRLTEGDLHRIIGNCVSKVLNEEAKKRELYESTMNRVMNYIKNYECATLTAWRNQYKDTTDKTFKPTHIYHEKNSVDGRRVGRGKKHNGAEMKQGECFSTEEKKFYNRELKAALLGLRYGVTNIRGSYKEVGQNESQEESFLVVNLNDDPNFKNNIFKLSEYYNQDSFMYSPKDSDEGYLVGTNNAEFPGYGNEISSGKFHRDVQSLFMSRIGNKGFNFSNGDRIDGDDPNRNDKLSDYEKNNYETDEPMTFADRKTQRMTESIENILQIETYDKYSINGKHAIGLCSPNLKYILS